MTPPDDLLQGTLDLLILKTLSWGPRHGYAIAKWLEQSTDLALQVEEGSLYPALYRMEKKGWLRAEWGRSELGRRAKFYHLTRAGRIRLDDEVARWRRVSRAVGRVVDAKAG
ncbi:MAG: PadR family transcriptional regulator [Gemmatimonadales bacterium]